MEASIRRLRAQAFPVKLGEAENAEILTKKAIDRDTPSNFQLKRGIGNEIELKEGLLA